MSNLGSFDNAILRVFIPLFSMGFDLKFSLVSRFINGSDAYFLSQQFHFEPHFGNFLLIFDVEGYRFRRL